MTDASPTILSRDVVLMVGAGHAAGEMAVALRSNGLDAEIVLCGEEGHPPYQRPALSKQFLTGAMAHEQLYLRSVAHFENTRVALISNARVVSIDRMARTITTSNGTVRAYSKLVLATGGRPRRLSLPDPRIDIAPNIHYLRTIDDVNRIRSDFKKGARLLVVGGGYIGLEVAAAARGLQLQVTVIEALPRLLARVAAPVVSEFFSALHRAAGVDILVNSQLTGFCFDSEGRAIAAVLDDGTQLPADLVLVGIGLVPNSELAQAAGLEVNNGIVVDAHGQTSDPDIFAIGDCSSHWNSHARRQVRLESVSSTVEQARCAAAFLTGKPIALGSVPWGWSDQYTCKLQIAGLNQGYDRVVVRGAPDSGSFLAFYLQNGALLAIDAVNRGRDFANCKKLVAARAQIPDAQLMDESLPIANLAAMLEPTARTGGGGPP